MAKKKNDAADLAGGMRVKVAQEALAEALGLVGRAVSSRSTLPILGNILLRTEEDGRLQLAATNLEVAITAWIGAVIEEEGAITIPARLLADYIGNLPPETVTLEVNLRTQTMHLACEGYESSIRGLDAADFPIIPRFPEDLEGPEGSDSIYVELDAKGLKDMCDQVVFAASRDESRPILTGIEVTFHEKMVAMAATDGYRLALRAAEIQKGSAPSKKAAVIVPARALGEIARAAEKRSDPNKPARLLITQNRNQIMAHIVAKDSEKIREAEIASQLIDAHFPDYRAIIPKSHNTRTVVDTAAFLKAIRVGFLFAKDNANIVNIHLRPPGEEEVLGKLTVSATSAEMGNSVTDMDAMIEGQELQIAMNAKYLIDSISTVEQAQIVLETSQPTRPMVGRPVGVDAEHFTHVIMPMHPPR